MPPTTYYEFGDVLLVPFPFSNQTTGKQRPAVVVSSATCKRERLDLILLAITSQIRLTLGIGEALVAQWKQAGLIKPSVLKPVLTTIEKGLVIKQLRKAIQRIQPREWTYCGIRQLRETAARMVLARTLSCGIMREFSCSGISECCRDQ